MVIAVWSLFPQNKNAASCLQPGVSEELYKALQRVLLCLDPLVDLMLTSGDAGENDYPLRLLQQEVADQSINTEAVTTACLSGSLLCKNAYFRLISRTVCVDGAGDSG